MYMYYHLNISLCFISTLTNRLAFNLTWVFRTLFPICKEAICNGSRNAPSLHTSIYHIPLNCVYIVFTLNAMNNESRRLFNWHTTVSKNTPPPPDTELDRGETTSMEISVQCTKSEPSYRSIMVPPRPQTPQEETFAKPGTYAQSYQ